MTELPQHLQRVLLVRHGHRYSTGFDPQLTRRGFFQAEGLAEMFRGSGIEIDAIFSSPFIRCLQTVTPLAKALGLKIRVDRGFSELLAHDWIFSSNPLPHLHYEQMRTTHAELPEVPQQLIDVDYDSPQPPYPDFVGPATPGDATQRQRPTARAKAALARAAVAGRRERTVLVMGHGASHDYVTEALIPGSLRLDQQTPFCVNHVAITTLLRQPDGTSVPRLLANGWQRTFRWTPKRPFAQPAETWKVNELLWTCGSSHRAVRVLTPHCLQLDAELFLLDSCSGHVRILRGETLTEAEPL
ncbi:unnamed protein product [Durusdinium trenchii]|uniref:Uncharacterized protein n=2 Tax=Durusdinium trenchii TaxID=1381693 RepID=A0ABP0MCM7_9DINO